MDSALPMVNSVPTAETLDRVVRGARRRSLAFWWVLSAVLLAVSFGLDMVAPKEPGGVVLFVTVIFISVLSARRALIATTSALAIILSWVGLGIAVSGVPGPDNIGHVLFARFILSSLSLAATGFLASVAMVEMRTSLRAQRHTTLLLQQWEAAQLFTRLSGQLAHLGTWTYRVATDELELSPEAAAIYGRTDTRPMSQKELFEAHVPHDRVRLEKFLNNRGSLAPFDANIEIVTLDGARRSVRVMGEATGGPDGQPETLRGVIQDITAAKAAALRDNVLQSELLLLKSAVARIDDIVLITDSSTGPEGGPVVVYVNEAFERLTGYTADEIVGKTPRILQGPDTDPEELRRISLALDAGEAVRAELVNYRKSGSEFWLELEIAPLVNSEGAVTHFVAIERDISERKARDAAMHQQAMLTRIGERLGGIGGWAAIPDRNEIYWSQGVRDLIEWNTDTPPALDETYAFYAPEAREVAAEALRLCWTEGTSFRIEVEGSTAQGRAIWCRLAGEAERDATGKIVRIVGAMQDISIRKRLQIERDAQDDDLRRTAQWLASAQAIGKIGSWQRNIKTGRVTASDQTYTLFGVEPDDQPRGISDFINFVHPDDRGFVIDHLQSPQIGAAPVDFVHRIVRADGEVRHMRQRAIRIDNPDGPVMSGTIQDVTDSQRAQQALRRSEERLRIIADVTVDVIWDWDVEQNTAWSNEGMVRYLGRTFQDGPLTVFSLWKRLHRDDRKRVLAHFKATCSSDASEWSDNFRAIIGDGETAHVICKGKLLRNRDGRTVRMVGSLNDVTEEHRLAEQLRLAHKLEAIGQLTGGVAHDFNNMLTVLLGNAELLEEALIDRPALRQLATMSRNAAGRAAQLTSRLLAFARRQPLDPRKADIDRLVDEMTPLLSRTLGDNIELRHVTGASVWQAAIDVSQLENAILNLCINARDAMPGGGRITIETTNFRQTEGAISGDGTLADGEYVVIAVIDTGTGMDPATVRQAFDPFFTTKGTGQGSGLGLSMVHGFCRQSTGQVRITSELGAGTTVRMFLPRAGEDLAEVEPPAPRLLLGPAHGHILMVEDNDIVRQHMENLLLGFGYAVTVAAKGSDALQLIEAGAAVDLLFTDVMLAGGMNGRQLAELACAARPSLSVLFTSGYAEEAIVHEGRLDTGVDFLPKPYNKAVLAERLQAAIARRGSFCEATSG